MSERLVTTISARVLWVSGVIDGRPLGLLVCALARRRATVVYPTRHRVRRAGPFGFREERRGRGCIADSALRATRATSVAPVGRPAWWCVSPPPPVPLPAASIRR